MAYISQTTRLSSLTIGGVDYTSSMVDWTCSDSSANRSGFVSTSGTVVIGQGLGSSDITDYSRLTFRRGTPVVLDIVDADGTVRRHPRGLLYVITSGYDIEGERLIVEIGCRLALAEITDDSSELLPLVPIPLNASQQTVQNVKASFQAAGQILWQDNQGTLRSDEYFDGDRPSYVTPGKWVSVIGRTALQVSPASTSGALPDVLKIAFSLPLGVNGDSTGRVDTVTETSNYFLSYPAVYFRRSPEGGVIPCDGTDCGGFSDDGLLVDPINIPGGGSYSVTVPDFVQEAGTMGTAYLEFPPVNPGNCGNTPPAPIGSSPEIPYPDPIDPGFGTTPPPGSCDENWVTVSEPRYVAARRISTNRSEYNAVAAQQSRVYNEVFAPAIEANGQYYADKFAYCRHLYGKACNPNGSCPMDGIEPILQSYSEKSFIYGESGELLETVTDTYRTTLSAAIATDWRSGSTNGVANNFRELSTEEMFHYERQVSEYYSQGGVNYEQTTVYTSSVSRGGGINAGPLSALSGIVTSSLRASSTVSSVSASPDRLNTPTAATREDVSVILLLDPQEYENAPPEAGPYTLEEGSPVPYLLPSSDEILEAKFTYENYLTRMVKGSSRAMVVAESLRPEIMDNWKPNDPFRVVDVRRDEVLAFRTDATVWGVSPDQSIMAVTGIYLGDSVGRLIIDGDNVVGDSVPNMDGTGAVPISPPTNVIRPPELENDVVPENVRYEVNVYMRFKASAAILSPNTLVPISSGNSQIRYQSNLQFFVAGLIVGPGDLVDTTGSGGIPVTNGGSLVVASATVIQGDLFS